MSKIVNKILQVRRINEKINKFFKCKVNKLGTYERLINKASQRFIDFTKIIKR